MRRDSSTEAEAIRRRVLLALAANRTPGFHVPGHLLGCAWPRIGGDDLEQTLLDDPLSRNVDGSTSLAAFCVLLDTALATASRLKIERGARQATVHLHAQFTGAPLRGDLKAHARMGGYTSGAAARQSLTSGTVFAEGTPACHASGTFVVLPPPPGVNLAPLPWQREDSGAPVAPLKPRELDPEERAVLKACNAALRRAGGHAFLEHFWEILPVPTGQGARCTVRLGPQHANRVRHVQGGLLLGLAAITARAAAPPALRGRGLVYQPRPGPGAEDRLKADSRRPQLRRGAHRDPERRWEPRAGGRQPSRGLMGRDVVNRDMRKRDRVMRVRALKLSNALSSHAPSRHEVPRHAVSRHAATFCGR